jgi:hypothetical protein
MVIGMKFYNPVVVFPMVMAWLCITIAIIQLMDTMECGLHALRLHW